MHYSSFIAIATLALSVAATSATNGEQQVQRRRLAAVMKPSLENPFGLLKRQGQSDQCGLSQEACSDGNGCCPIFGGCCLDGCCNSGSYCDPDATAATEKPCICFGSDCPDDEDSTATSSSYVPTATLPAPQTSTSSRAATSTAASSSDGDDSAGIASGTSGPTPSSTSGGSSSGGSSGSSSGGSGSTSGGGSASGAERTGQTVAGIGALIAAMGVAVLMM